MCSTVCTRIAWKSRGSRVESERDGIAETLWRCGRCGTALVMRSVTVKYLAASFPVELPSCPTCRMTLVSEELARGRMAEVERIMEDK